MYKVWNDENISNLKITFKIHKNKCASQMEMVCILCLQHVVNTFIQWQYFRKPWSRTTFLSDVAFRSILGSLYQVLDGYRNIHKRWKSIASSLRERWQKNPIFMHLEALQSMVKSSINNSLYRKRQLGAFPNMEWRRMLEFVDVFPHYTSKKSKTFV